MALIKCKECGKEISTDAKNCPHCGKKRTSRATKIVLYLFIIGFAITIFSGVIGNLYKEKEQAAERKRLALLTPEQRKIEDEQKKNEIQKQDEAKNKEYAWFACQEFIKKNLKNPNDAEYLGDYSVNKKSDIYRVIMRVRARNSFNALVLNSFDCQVGRSKDGNWILLSLKERDR